MTYERLKSAVFAYLTINNLFLLVKVVIKLAKIVDLKLKIYLKL